MLTDEERQHVAEYVAAAWAAKSDRGFAEGWEVRSIVLDLAEMIHKLDGAK